MENFSSNAKAKEIEVSLHLLEREQNQKRIQINLLADKIDLKNRYLTAMECAIDELRSKKDRLQAELAEVRAEIEQTKGRHRTLVSISSQSELEVDEIVRGISKLNVSSSTNTKAQEKLQTATLKKTALDDQVRQQKIQISIQKDRIQLHNTKVVAISSRLDETLHAIDVKRAGVAEATAELNQHKGRQQGLISEAQTREQQIKKLEADLRIHRVTVTTKRSLDPPIDRKKDSSSSSSFGSSAGTSSWMRKTF